MLFKKDLMSLLNCSIDFIHSELSQVEDKCTRYKWVRCIGIYLRSKTHIYEKDLIGKLHRDQSTNYYLYRKPTDT